MGRPSDPATEPSAEPHPGSRRSPRPCPFRRLRYHEPSLQRNPGYALAADPTAFIPKPGCKFIVSDYSSIEARVLAHIAGEKWRSKVFAEGKDIYCASASQMFGVPVEK